MNNQQKEKTKVQRCRLSDLSIAAQIESCRAVFVNLSARCAAACAVVEKVAWRAMFQELSHAIAPDVAVSSSTTAPDAMCCAVLATSMFHERFQHLHEHRRLTGARSSRRARCSARGHADAMDCGKSCPGETMARSTSASAFVAPTAFVHARWRPPRRNPP